MPLDQVQLPLFLPASRMDRLDKALASGADAIIVDLEDAVAVNQKDEARRNIQETFRSITMEFPVIVRINGVGTPWHNEDVELCSNLPIAAVMLPKAERPQDCFELASRTRTPIVGLVETAVGLRRAEEIAGGCALLAFGSIDYAADLALAHTREALLYARSSIVLACRLACRPAPIDGVTTALHDPEVLLSDCQHALAMGMGGKMLVHPAQVEPARKAFAPTVDEIAWATRVANATINKAIGAISVDGAMVDAPVINRARRILDHSKIVS